MDVDAGLRAMRTLQTRVRQLGLADFLDINIPQGRLAAQMSLIRRLLNNAKISDLLEVNLDRSKLTSQLSELKSITATIPIGFDVAKLPKLGPTEPIRVPVTFDTSQLPKLGPVGDLTGNIDVSKIKSASTALAGVAAAEKLVADSELKAADGARTQSLQTALAAARLTDMGTALRKLDGQLKDTVGITAELTAADALLGGQAARLAQNYTSLARAQALGARAAQDLAVATTAAAGGSGGKGGLAGLAAAAAAGGANFGRFRGFLGGAIGGVSLFHIALDLVVEGFIALTLAALAAAPAIAVMVNVSKDISTHLQAVHAVTESLGQDIPPLTGKFDALAHAMAPQVIEAYGGALNLIDSQTSLFGQAVERVLPVFNTWIAKIDLFAQSQQFGKFISSGIGYLNQFAGILGTVGQALTNLLNKDPGIARFLLDAIQGLATLLKLFTDLPAPVVTAVLALHGLYLWARVMGGILISLAGYFTKVGLGIAGLVGPMLGLTEATGPFAKTILGLSAVSWGWIGLAAAGLGILAYEFFQASNGAKDFIARLEQGLTDTGIQNDMAAISGQIGNLNTEMSLASAKTGELVSGLNSSVAKSAGFFSQVLKDAPLSNKEFTDLAKGIWEGAKALAGFQSAGLSMRQNNNDIKLYRDEITKLLGAQDALFNETGLLVTQGHTWDQALALEAIAGVQWNDTADVMRQKVDNLVKGYQNMSVQGGILNNSVNAVTFATLQQQSKIKDLTDGWSAFLKLVTGGASSFITFEQQVIGIAGAAAGAADTLNISNGRVSASTRGVGAAAAGASTSITGLSSDSLQLRATFLQGVTDASNLQNSLLDLASASGLGAKGNDLLTQASKDAVAQLLPMAKGSTELTTTLYALAQQGGYQGADSFKELSKWVDTASGTMHTAKDPAKQLDDITAQLTQDAGSLTDDVKNLSIALGTQLTGAMAQAIIVASGGQDKFNKFADAVLNSHTKSTDLQKAANDLGNELIVVTGNADTAKQQFESLAIGGLHLSKDKADELWNNFISRGNPSLGSLKDAAGKTQKQFEDMAAQLGVTKTDADNLYAALQTVKQGSPYTVTLAENGSGNFTISENGTNYTISPGGFLSPHAAGGYISAGTGPTADDVPILVSRGETVVSASDSKVLAPAFSALGVPGYARGGIPFANMGRNITSFHKAFVDASTITLAGAMAATLSAAEKKAVAELAGSGSSIAQYAATWLGKIPYVWGGTSLGPAGADCSGFTQAVYHHFNINAPRRSEDQGSWVQRSGPVPGGLAFYHSPPGGADPGHVAIVGGGGNVISQGGGMGPTVEALNFLPLLWTGIPPGGFPGGGGGGTTGGSMSAAAVAALWDQMGGAPSAAGNMAQIAFFESGDNPSAIQQGQPPATTGWGLYQITPTSGITQNGAYGNLLNAANNTKAAISLFNQDGYRPWASDPIGFQLASAPFGFARGGRIPGFRAGGSVNTGGLIPGYALGGLPGLADGAYITPSFPATVATDIAGANFLQAWTTRHGGGPGADWGPIPVNLQIDAANARLKSDSVLAKAAGLTNAQHTMYAARAAADKVNITRQLRELGIMRQWRLDLEAQQANANSYVAAAGSTPGLAGNVRTWKSQAAWDQATIDKVSFMLGLNAAQIAAAIAAGQLGPGGLPLPGITHQFGGDLVNGILTFLHSVSAPLGAAAGMKIGSYDSGGHLPPGLSMAWNGTGRPEPVGFGGGPAAITLEVDDAGGSAFEQFMAMTIRKYVKVRSGGNVQRAFGTPGTVSGSSNWRNG